MVLVTETDRRARIRAALAKLHILVVISLGCACIAAGMSHWRLDDPLRASAYLLLSLAGLGMEIALPGVDGTMSVNFFFVLLSMVELGAPETLAIGCLAIFLQRFWRARNSTKLIQLAFNLSMVATAIFVSCRVYESAWLKSAGLQFPLLLALASCAYFLMNTVPLAIIISLSGKQSFAEVWRSSYAWTFPYYASGAALTAALHAISLRFGWQVSFLGLPVIFLVYRTYRVYLDRMEAERKRLEAECSHAEQQKRHAEDVANLHLRTIESLALAIDAKDQTTHSHLQRVQIYAVEIGKELGLSDLELDALRAASVLHDIGKLAVPEHIISKPGKLTREEFEKMKIHPVVGAEILECVQFPYPVAPIVRSHHEKWDGTGYPEGLQGEAIPIGSRILSVVDCLDALASDRQYRRALPLAEAMATVKRESGKSFDPAIVAILESRHVELERKAREAIQDCLKLSTDIKITRGAAPDAGFESAMAEPVSGTGQASSGRAQSDALSPIGAARIEVQRLLDMTESTENVLTLEETLAALANRLKAVVPFDTLAFYTTRQDRLIPACVVGQEKELFSSLEIPVGEGLSGWVAQNYRTIVNGNPSVECGYLNDPKKFSALRSALSLPLTTAGGLTGVLTLYRAERDAFTQAHLRILLSLNTKLCALFERHPRHSNVNRDMTIDPVTELPNARSFLIHLEREARHSLDTGRSLSVAMCGLHNLQQVKDQQGSLQADRVLKSFVSKLRDHCRPEDFIARLGWSELGIVLQGPAGHDSSAIDRFHALVEEISARLAPGQSQSVSFASAQLGKDGSEADQLLSVADERLNHGRERLARERIPAQAATVIPFAVAVQQTRIA